MYPQTTSNNWQGGQAATIMGSSAGWPQGINIPSLTVPTQRVSLVSRGGEILKAVAALDAECFRLRSTLLGEGEVSAATPNPPDPTNIEGVLVTALGRLNTLVQAMRSINERLG